MYKLYYSPGACSMAPHVVLNEIGMPFEAVKVDLHAGEGQKPEFLKINPRGQVPVLVTETGQVIREGAAILIYLMDKHQSPLLPAIDKNGGKDRAAALEWLCFANATMHPAYGKIFGLMRLDIDKATQEKLVKAGIEQINKLWKEVDTRLAQTPYIAGKDITAADILLSVIANWGGYFPAKPELGANVKRMLAEVTKRPSYQEALKSEQVEYKAAA
jgi:glutathione S-transferase